MANQSRNLLFSPLTWIFSHLISSLSCVCDQSWISKFLPIIPSFCWPLLLSDHIWVLQSSHTDQPPVGMAISHFPEEPGPGRDKLGRDLRRASAFHGMQMDSLSTSATKQSKTKMSLYYFFYCSFIYYYYCLLFCHSIIFAEYSCSISSFCKVLWNKYEHHNWFILWIWPVLDVSPFPTQTIPLIIFVENKYLFT